MASKEVRGSFCRYDSCVITDQSATDAGALERELLAESHSDAGGREPAIPAALEILV